MKRLRSLRERIIGKKFRKKAQVMKLTKRMIMMMKKRVKSSYQKV
jgi:hypothetical protein